MMGADDILDRDALLPGDVVLDMATHRPMQVAGYDARTAVDVPAVWESDTNQHEYQIGPDEPVLKLVDVPTGTHYFVPTTIQRYPETRLSRLLVEQPTDERRPQEKVARAVLASLVSDLRSTDHSKVAEAVILMCRKRWGDKFADEVDDFADSMDTGFEDADD